MTVELMLQPGRYAGVLVNVTAQARSEFVLRFFSAQQLKVRPQSWPAGASSCHAQCSAACHAHNRPQTDTCHLHCPSQVRPQSCLQGAALEALLTGLTPAAVVGVKKRSVHSLGKDAVLIVVDGVGASFACVLNASDQTLYLRTTVEASVMTVRKAPPAQGTYGDYLRIT